MSDKYINTEKNMHSEIEKLIKMASKNGDISQKEKDIILRKANNLGLSIDDISKIDKIIKDINKPLTESEINKIGAKEIIICPNCGAETSRESANCEYCEFVLANKEARSKIDNFILKIEDDFVKINTLAKVTFVELSLFFAVIYFSVFANLSMEFSHLEGMNYRMYGSLFMIVISITLLMKNRRAFRFFSEYGKIKKESKQNIADFSKYFPRNKKLKELKNNFNERITKITNDLRKNILKAGVVNAIIVIIIFAVFFINPISSNKHLYKDCSFKISTNNFIFESENGYETNFLVDDIFITFREQEYMGEDMAVSISAGLIRFDVNGEFNTNISDSIDYVYYFTLVIDGETDTPLSFVGAVNEYDFFYHEKEKIGSATILFNKYTSKDEASRFIKYIEKADDLKIKVKFEETIKQ